MATVTVGSSPAAVDLVSTRGDRIPRTVFAFGDVDLSDRDWAAMVRADRDRSGDILATFTVDDSDAANGNIAIELPASECANCPTVNGKGKFYWDMQATVKTDVENVKTWFAGRVILGGDVTVVA